MKKLESILAILLLCAAYSIAQNNKNDWTEKNLKGKVKSIKWSSYYNTAEQISEMQKGKIVFSDGFVFNEWGYTIEEDLFREDDGKRFKYILKYDDKRNKIAENIYNADGSLFKKNTYQYDDKGNKVQNDYFNGILDSKETFQYDDKGNLIEMKQYNSDGSLLYTGIEKYDDKGYKMESYGYTADGKLAEKRTFQCDNKGNVIEDNEYRANGDRFSKYTFRYDEVGNVIVMEEYKSDGSLLCTTTYQYVYDKNLNWIKQTTYRTDMPNDMKYKITERAIEYY